MTFFALFIIFMIVALPIAFSMGAAGVIFFSLNDVPLNAIAQKILTGTDSFVLLAIPLYILAGELMEGGGISRRILDLAGAIVGHIRGGLGHVVVVATMIMSGISGSSTADTAAIGSSMIPSMIRKGYAREQAVAIIAAAGGMDVLIPPCINMIVLGGVANLSVAHLFFAGILPAVVMALGLMSIIYVQAKKQNVPLEPRHSSKELWVAFKDSFWALLIPVIILGGIKAGWFTATEGAVVAVIYSALISLFIYHEITFKDIPDILLRSVRMSGVILFLTGMSTLFAWITAREQIPVLLMNFITGISSEPWVFLLITNIVLLIIGSVLEGAPAIIILVPLFMPVALKLGIDPIHYGTVMIANIGVGFLLPPVGICLLVACSVGKIDVGKVVKPITPFFICMVVSLLLITYIPAISLFLPKMLGYVPVGSFL